MTTSSSTTFLARLADDESGFSTAELLGNAALGIAALAAIWAGLQQMGIDVIAQMRGALGL